jgi:hypothetical protein
MDIVVDAIETRSKSASGRGLRLKPRKGSGKHAEIEAQVLSSHSTPLLAARLQYRSMRERDGKTPNRSDRDQRWSPECRH